jgi:hypothetical protein
MNSLADLLQGDLFSGLNDGLLSRAEALAAVDMQKHQSSHAAHQQMTQQLKVSALSAAAEEKSSSNPVLYRFTARRHVPPRNGRTSATSTTGER